MVPTMRLELIRPKSLPPQDSVSTNFTTSAVSNGSGCHNVPIPHLRGAILTGFCVVCKGKFEAPRRSGTTSPNDSSPFVVSLSTKGSPFVVSLSTKGFPFVANLSTKGSPFVVSLSTKGFPFVVSLSNHERAPGLWH